MRSCLLWVVALLAIGIYGGCGRRETPVDASVRTKTLYLGNNAEPRDLDPHIVVAYTDYNLMVALFEGLTVLDETTSQPLPGVAEKWEVSPDNLVYTFHLRPTALWSDGTPLSAEDFAFSIERVLNAKLAAEYEYLLSPLAGADDYNQGKITDFSRVGVKVIDSKTLQLTLQKPTPYFLTLLALPPWYPVQKSALTKAGDIHQRATGWTSVKNFVGNGPFTLEEWIPDQRIAVKKSPHYYGAASNKIERVVFYPISNPAVEEASFRTGQLHVTNEVLPDRISTFQRENPNTIRVDPFLESFFLRFNVTKQPFDNKLVRQALARAIDREAIAGSVMRGSVTPAYALTPTNTAGYTCSGKIPTDFAAARQLLAAAGYPNGKGFPHFEIKMDSSPANLLIFQAVQQTWRKELNVDVALSPVEYRVYVDDMHRLSFQTLRSRWVGDYDDPSTFTNMFVSNSGDNNTGWKNPEYDRLIEAASNEPVREKRYGLLNQAETLMLDEAPMAPIYFGARSFLISPHLKNWVPSLLGVHRYQTLSIE